MNPAPSVIIFTTLSGAGFGLLVWLGLGLPGVTLSSSPTNFSLYSKLQISRFDGVTWEPIGPVIEAGAAKTN